MPTIYEHHKPNYRLYAWARGRMDEIDEQVRQLKLERGLMETIAADCKAKHCPECDGEAIVMKPIPGCECDGPRQHTCERCGGTGGVAVAPKGCAPGELEYASWFTASAAYMAACSHCNADCPSPQACGRAERLSDGVPGLHTDQPKEPK